MTLKRSPVYGQEFQIWDKEFQNRRALWMVNKTMWVLIKRSGATKICDFDDQDFCHLFCFEHILTQLLVERILMRRASYLDICYQKNEVWALQLCYVCVANLTLTVTLLFWTTYLVLFLRQNGLFQPYLNGSIFMLLEQNTKATFTNHLPRNRPVTKITNATFAKALP